ncbi:MAG: Uncharacterized protein G01um101456_150 [Parcubacteria group bacterium Gr01-1014_56]|nr:MAG: Uncharacterized protein G01um101456_150 [Parcubacteria group bacterium Gr01-1014_56]
MEKFLKIKTPDKHLIYGTLELPKKPSSTLVIFVHGLTGHSNEHIFYNGARFFEKKGIASFRFDLYTDALHARMLQDCSISTHAQDLNIVIKYFRKKYKKIFVVGHSLGGITILLSDSSVIDGVILWDGTYSLKGRNRTDLVYEKRINAYLATWGVQHVMSKEMYNEWMNFPRPKDAVKKITKPFKVIVAGKGHLIKTGKEYYKYAEVPKEFSVIKSAYHTFDEGDTEKELFNETYSFVRKYSK